MGYLRLLMIVLGLWGGIELLMGIVGLFTYEVGTSRSLIISLVCLLAAAAIHIFCRVLCKKNKKRYLD